jgi:hypothetical protein
VASYDVKQAFILAHRPKGRDLYRFVRLSPDLVKILVGLAPDMAPFMGPDGSMLVEMNYMLYGYVEAGRQWYDYLMKVYLDFGFTINVADPCVIHYRSAAGEVHGTVTVDDTLFTYSSEQVLLEVDDMYVKAFGVGGFTTEKGDDFGHLGMRIVQNRADKSIAVSQSDFVSELQTSATPMFFKYGVRRGITASDPDIFEEEEGGVDVTRIGRSIAV